MASASRTAKAAGRPERIDHRSYERQGIDKIDAYFASFAKRDAQQKALIGTIVNGKVYTAQDYQQWRLAQIGRGQRFEALRDRLAERMTNANLVAASYINDATPGLYSLNRNYAAYTIERQVGRDVGFDLWDEQTVRRLMVEQPDLMPYYPPARAVDRGVDLACGKRQITAQVTNGILQGESIKHLADRFQTNIPNMNRTSAIRSAWTAVTGAQNAGRQDSYLRAEKMGIRLKKRWLAMLDSRTRHDHAAADGQAVKQDEPFVVGGAEMMYLGDPNGPPEQVYNCRCTMIAEVEGVDMSGALRWDRYGILPDMTYAQWEASKRGAEAEAISPIRTKEVMEWWKSLQNQGNLAILKERIAPGKLSTRLSYQQYLKHVEGTPAFQDIHDQRKEATSPGTICW